MKPEDAIDLFVSCAVFDCDHCNNKYRGCAEKEKFKDFSETVVAALDGTETRAAYASGYADGIEFKSAEWIGFTTSSYAGTDDIGDPKWIDKKFYRCSKCRKGTVIKSNYCPSCGAKMQKQGDRL